MDRQNGEQFYLDGLENADYEVLDLEETNLRRGRKC